MDPRLVLVHPKDVISPLTEEQITGILSKATPGTDKRVVANFLTHIKIHANAYGAMYSLFLDAKIFRYNDETVKTITTGIIDAVGVPQQ